MIRRMEEDNDPFNAGWNRCQEEATAEIGRLRAALKPFAEFDPHGWPGPILKGFSRKGQETLLKREHFDAAYGAYEQKASNHPIVRGGAGS